MDELFGGLDIDAGMSGTWGTGMASWAAGSLKYGTGHYDRMRSIVEPISGGRMGSPRSR